MEFLKEANRPLDFEATFNTRELGGYMTRDAKRIRNKKLLRSDTLSNLTQTDMEKISDYGVRTVIDLRRSKEVEEGPCKLRGYKDIKYYNVSLSTDDDGLMHGKVNESLFELYRTYLTERQPQIKEILELINDHLADGILFNCMAGKDRTGVISMLLLKICDVDEETIKMDYEVSEQNIRTFLERRKARLNRKVPDFLLRSNRVEIEKTLRFLDEEYGSVNKYLTHIQVEPQVLNEIRKSVLY